MKSWVVASEGIKWAHNFGIRSDITSQIRPVELKAIKKKTIVMPIVRIKTKNTISFQSQQSTFLFLADFMLLLLCKFNGIRYTCIWYIIHAWFMYIPVPHGRRACLYLASSCTCLLVPYSCSHIGISLSPKNFSHFVFYTAVHTFYGNHHLVILFISANVIIMFHFVLLYSVLCTFDCFVESIMWPSYRNLAL